MNTSFHNSELNTTAQKALLKKASAYTNKLESLTTDHSYTRAESSLAIAGDTAYQRKIKKALNRFTEVKHVILVGIGGSSLGTEAIFYALSDTKNSSLLVLDSIENGAFTELESLLKKVSNMKQIALVVASKSGSTTETVVNAEKVLEICTKKYGEKFYTQTIFIGDPETPLLKVAKKKKILCFTLPPIIGGRYSVFSAIGIVPLTLLKIDVEALCSGATAVLNKSSLEHIATQSAILASHAETGVHVINFFTFEKRLLRTGYWYRQLLAESIGKSVTRKGAPFTHQLLPIVSTSVDLHSMSELYLCGGYKHIYTYFLSCGRNATQHIPATHWTLEHTPSLTNKTHDFIARAIMHGVFSAYDDQKLPYQHSELSACIAYEIGYLFATRMAEVMCLAHLFDIDAFHQPSVEQYKKHTRALLDS